MTTWLQVKPSLLSWSQGVTNNRSTLALEARHQLLNLRFLLASERQKWQPRRAAIVTVDVHGVLHAGDPEVTDHALGSHSHTLLFFAGQRIVSVFERGVDFVARHGRWAGKGENSADSS